MENLPIVVGFTTSNIHKIREATQCLQQINPSISVIALPVLDKIEENGSTFCDNARLKLKSALSNPIPSEVTYVIAEDSGLIVDALDGKYGLSPFPGVYSNRWFSSDIQKELLGNISQPEVDYHRCNQGILKLMEEILNRKARYETCIAIWSKKTGRIVIARGTVLLEVANRASGENGFGYDPIMIPIEHDSERTMSELEAEEKNRISHRYKALSKAAKEIEAG